jgi:MYXO-CTERM domain-containing protein
MRSHVQRVGPRLSWLPLALLLPAAPALAAVRFDTSATTAASGSASLGLNVGTGANRYVIVALVMPASAQLAAGAQFGGRSMGPIGSAQAGGCHVEVWGLPAPASGTGVATAAVSPGTTPIILAAASYDGVHQTLPTDDTSAQRMGNTAAAQGTIYNSDGLGFAALCAGGSMIAATPRAGQGSRWNHTTGTLLSAGSDVTGGTADWQLSASGALSWAVASFPLRAAPGGSPPPPDASTVADAALPPAPDAGARDVGAGPDATIADDGAEVDGATVPDAGAAAARDGQVIAAPLPTDGDETPDAAPRVINLVVGTGCRAAGASPPVGPGALALAGVALLVLVARRRRR